MTDALPGLLSSGSAVQEEIAKVVGYLACVLTENTVIKKVKDEPCFDEAVCNGVTFVCSDCDSDAATKKGDLHCT